jgi:hypothetical protein
VQVLVQLLEAISLSYLCSEEPTSLAFFCLVVRVNMFAERVSSIAEMMMPRVMMLLTLLVAAISSLFLLLPQLSSCSISFRTTAPRAT